MNKLSLLLQASIKTRTTGSQKNIFIDKIQINVLQFVRAEGSKPEKKVNH